MYNSFSGLHYSALRSLIMDIGQNCPQIPSISYYQGKTASESMVRWPARRVVGEARYPSARGCAGGAIGTEAVPAVGGLRDSAGAPWERGDVARTSALPPPNHALERTGHSGHPWPAWGCPCGPPLTASVRPCGREANPQDREAHRPPHDRNWPRPRRSQPDDQDRPSQMTEPRPDRPSRTISPRPGPASPALGSRAWGEEGWAVARCGA